MKKSKNYLKSLRFRILMILVFIGIVPSVAGSNILLSNYEKKALEVRVESISSQCDILCNLLVREKYLKNPNSETVTSKLEVLCNTYEGRVLLVDKDFRVVKDTYHVDEGKTVLLSEVIRSFKGEEVVEFDKEQKKLRLAFPVRSPQAPKIQGVMVVTASIRGIEDTVYELKQNGLVLIGMITAFSILIGYFFSTILVKPFARIVKSIEDLTDGYHNDEISVPDYTETELIADAFNKLLNRMKVIDESRQEFVSNVSHELKTPMTSIKVLADSLVGQQGLSEELYQEFLTDITAEIDRENKIITDLLSLVKLDKKAADMNIEHMDMNQLLEDILKRLRPIAEKRNIDLILDSFRSVEADVDEVKFTLAMSNLVENGIKYNVDDGWVRVSLDADHKFFFVTVEDSGMGIPEDCLERIFERFYRVDKSHSKEIGGTGLGLSITRSTVAMHRGTIKVSSKEGEGTKFIVKIPLTYIP